MKPRVVRPARSTRQAFRSVAFSRSSNPILPRSCEQVTESLGHSSRKMRAASSSQLGLRGENTEAMAAAVRPRSRMRRPACRTAAVSRGTIGRPSYSWPPSTMNTSPRTRRARSSGQSSKGGSEALAGSPMRRAATGDRSRRWTTALVKCVVPIMTASMPPARAGIAAVNNPRALTIPVVTSGVVGVLVACTTRSSSRRTASVLVPPTSMPMRRIRRTPRRSRGRSRRRAGRRARSPSA